VTKRGRPKKSGARYASGQLRPDAGREATAWRRILGVAIQLGLNPLLGTQLGRLGVLNELAAHHVETGFRIAEIYGRYEHAIGRRRSVASPSYETGCGRMMDAETDSASRRARAATRAFGALQAELLLCPRGARAAIEELCVEDRVCPPGALPTVKIALDLLSISLGMRRRGG
jgi:hypothetical protein